MSTLAEQVAEAKQILDETHPKMGGTGKALASANERIRELEAKNAAMYAAGAADMKERAAINHEVLFNDALGADAIRALPISDSPNTFTPTNPVEGEQG